MVAVEFFYRQNVDRQVTRSNWSFGDLDLDSCDQPQTVTVNLVIFLGSKFLILSVAWLCVFFSEYFTRKRVCGVSRVTGKQK